MFYDQVAHIWICSGYQECHEILGNHRAFSSARPHDTGKLKGRGFDEVTRIVDTLLRQMLFSDPPDHTAVRSSLAREFTPAHVLAQDEMLRAMVADVLGERPTRARSTSSPISPSGYLLGWWPGCSEWPSTPIG